MTLIKNIEILYKLTQIELDNFVIEVASGDKKSFNSHRILAKGFLIGKINKTLTTHIIYLN